MKKVLKIKNGKDNSKGNNGNKWLVGAKTQTNGDGQK